MIMYTYMSDTQIPVRKKKEAESSTARESQQNTQNRRQKSETLAPSAVPLRSASIGYFLP